MIIKKIDGSKEIKTNVKDSRTGEIGISQRNMAKMADHVTKNLYSNIHGSIIREYVSNAYDAHIDRMKAEFIEDGGHSADHRFSRDQIRFFSDNMTPIHVKIGRDGQGHYLSIRDFGLGMNEEQINLYFRNFGESSKDTHNDELGAFGVGSKSFQTYTDACYYSTIHRENGKNIKRDFMMLATEGLPVFKPLSDESGDVTDEECGTTVKMYIKQNDIWNFKEEAQQQLLYFKKVFFDIDGFDNDYKIFETDLFMYSDTEALREVHAVLGVVAYPIDFKKIGLPTELADCPIGVKFDVGDFGVTLSREEIRYAPETKELIKRKVVKALLKAVEMYNDTLTDGYQTLLDYARNFSSREYRVMLGDTTTMRIGNDIIDWAKNDHNVEIQPVVVHEYPDYDFSRFKDKSGFQTLMRGIDAFQFINKGTVRLKKNPRYSWHTTNGHWKVNQNAHGFSELFGNDESKTKKIVYWGKTDETPSVHQVRECHDIHDKDKTVWVVKGFDRNNVLSDRADDWSVKHFAVGLGIKVGKEAEDEQWFIDTCEVYAKMRKSMAVTFPVMNDVTVSAVRKKELREKYTEARTGNGRVAGSVTIYEYQWNRLVRPTNSYSVKVADLDTHFKDCIVVYVDKKNAPHDDIEPFFRERHWRDGSFKTKYNVKFVAVTSSNIDKMASMKNSYTLDELYSHPYFVKEMAVMKNRVLVQNILKGDNDELTNRYRAIDKALGTDLNERFEKLRKYKHDHVTVLPWIFDHKFTAEGFFKKHPTAKDEKYLKECLELSQICRKLEFIKFFNTHEEGCIEVMKEWVTCKGLSIKGLNA